MNGATFIATCFAGGAIALLYTWLAFEWACRTSSTEHLERR